MNKIRIIDLLNKIANGEQPPKIKYDKHILKYNKDEKRFIDENGLNSLYEIDFADLNYEIEILEGEKKIPEKLEEYVDVSGDLACQWTFGEKKLKDKFNEIIDYLDYLKSKGE